MSDFDDRTLDERLAAFEPSAMMYKYGIPGALIVMKGELDRLRADAECLRHFLEVAYDDWRMLQDRLNRILIRKKGEGIEP